MLIAPALLCLDCQRFAEGSRTGEATGARARPTAAIADALAYARAAGWTILYAQRKDAAGPYARTRRAAAPIEALRPGRHEAIFERDAPCAYQSAALAAALEARHGAPVFLVGFNLDGAAAATLREARRRCHHLTVITSALGGPPIAVRADARLDALPTLAPYPLELRDVL